MKKFEYKRFPLYEPKNQGNEIFDNIISKFEDIANTYGASGWELVNISEFGSWWKREVIHEKMSDEALHKLRCNENVLP